MSTIFRGLNTVDPMPSNIDTGSRMFGHNVGRTMFRFGSESQDCNVSNMQLRSNHDFENVPDLRSRVHTFEQTMGYQNQLHQNSGTTNPVNTSTTSRRFGLHSRNFSSASSLHQDDNLRLNSIIDGMHQKSSISTVSKTFGLISDDRNIVATQNNERYNSDLRGNGTFNSSVIPRPFGLHTRTLTSQSRVETVQDGSRINQDKNITNFRSTIPRNFLGSDKLGGLISNQNEGFNQGLKRNSINSSVLPRPFGLQSRTLAENSEMGLRVNQDSTLRNNNISDISKTFGPTVRDPVGFNTQEKVDLTYNNDITDNGSFRKPTLSRMIRGRSSIVQSRLFQNQNIKRHCKDLSNINGYNVSHISSRDFDTQLDSRLAFNARSNWMDNQSMSGSFLSVTSMKLQFMNLLENLHHSILNIGPQVTAEAVRMEFDRAKQRLENISEMSCVSSVKESGIASETYQTSKNTCPAINKPTTSACINGGSLNLKSSKDLIQTLISGKRTHRDKFNSTTLMKDDGRRKLCTVSSQNTKSNDEESVFKKPEPYIKSKNKRKSSRMLKIKVSEVVESLTSMAKNKVVNLKEWYPIAVESNLALGGINEEGAIVRTAAVKKRVNNRKVELINGLICNLIGSPSDMVSVLPKKIISLLKNGLTDKWRMLQKELLNCQTTEEQIKQRVSKSPNVKGSPKKKKRKAPKVISTPKKEEKVAEVRTRSGRTIKPPSMFWIAANSNEVSSTTERSISEIILRKEQLKKRKVSTPVKKLKKITHESSIKSHEKVVEASPKKKQNTSRELNKKGEKSPKRKVKASPETSKKEDKSVKNSKKEQLKAKNTRNKKKESDEEQRVHSSRGITKREQRSRNMQRKRRRDVNGDPESVQAKKSKLEKNIEPEVESTVHTSESVSKSGKVILSASPVSNPSKHEIYSKQMINKNMSRFQKKKSKLTLDSRSPKLKGKKSSPLKRKNVEKKTKSKSERKTESKEVNESQEDFQLKLDDIEIPEIASVSRNPQLSRSQMRLISMETPPLKYFNTNLHLMSSSTPVRSPSWCLSQRTESEVKQFQKRREEAFKKKIKVDIKKTVITEKSKNVQNRDVKRVMEWVAEKTVKSPTWNSKVLQYVIPSRKQLEERINQEDEDVETEFF